MTRPGQPNYKRNLTRSARAPGPDKVPAKPYKRKNKPLIEDLKFLPDVMPVSAGGSGLTHAQAAAKHGVSKQHVDHALARPDVRAIHREWQENAFNAHRRLGPVALRALAKLLEDGDPYTVNQFWKRMGVTMEPAQDIFIEELKVEMPPEVADMLRKMALPAPAKDEEK